MGKLSLLSQTTLRKNPRSTSKSSGWNCGKHLLQICTPLHSSKPLSSTSLRINFLASPPGSTERCTCQTGFNGWKFQSWLVSRMNIFTCFLMSSLEWLVNSGCSWFVCQPYVHLTHGCNAAHLQYLTSLQCYALYRFNFHPPVLPHVVSVPRGLSWTSCPSASQTKPRPNRHAMKLFGQQKDAWALTAVRHTAWEWRAFCLCQWCIHMPQKKKRTKEYANDVSSNCSPRLEDVPMSYGIAKSSKIW